MTTKPDSNPSQSDSWRYVLAALAGMLVFFLAYSTAAWLGLGRGLIFPVSYRPAGTDGGLVTGARLPSSGTCGEPGPQVRREAQAVHGVQVIRIDVTDHFEPNIIVVRRMIPLQIQIVRQLDTSCSDKIVFGGFGVTRRLPLKRPEVVTIFPTKPGEYPFSCGFNMMTGKVIVL